MLECSENVAELGMVDPDNDGKASVGPVSFGPAAGKVREVGDIERHHDPAVTGGKFEERLIGHAIEAPFFVGSADVVAALAKSGGDTTPGDMGVEQ